MKVIFALLTVAVAALAQDTHFCPDNWELHVSLFFIKFLISPIFNIIWMELIYTDNSIL